MSVILLWRRHLTSWTVFGLIYLALAGTTIISMVCLKLFRCLSLVSVRLVCVVTLLVEPRFMHIWRGLCVVLFVIVVTVLCLGVLVMKCCFR